MSPFLRTAGIATCVLGAALAAQEPVPVFRSSIDSVSVDVSVMQGGRPVADLTAQDFELRDNGIPQTVWEVTHEALPIDVTLVIDLSGSVTGQLFTALEHAIASVRSHLRATDRASVVTFTHHIREAVPLQSGTAPLADGAIERTGGATSLFDAIAAAIIAPREADRRQMAIILTDGDDNASFLDAGQVLAAAAHSDMAVFTVMLQEPGARTALVAPPNQEFFKTLAETTGGQTATVDTNQDLAGSFVRALDAFRTGYVLRYTVKNAKTSGWHELSVRIVRRGQYEVRARRGYFGSAADDTTRPEPH